VPGQLSQRNHTADRDTARLDGWREQSVANPTFLERLGSECTERQWLSELTVDGLGAIAALGNRTVGRVVWDLPYHAIRADHAHRVRPVRRCARARIQHLRSPRACARQLPWRIHGCNRR
jgi:hypothetical protein